jgi:hypothetical protein
MVKNLPQKLVIWRLFDAPISFSGTNSSARQPIGMEIGKYLLVDLVVDKLAHFWIILTFIGSSLNYVV